MDSVSLIPVCSLVLVKEQLNSCQEEHSLHATLGLQPAFSAAVSHSKGIARTIS